MRKILAFFSVPKISHKVADIINMGQWKEKMLLQIINMTHASVLIEKKVLNDSFIDKKIYCVAKLHNIA